MADAEGITAVTLRSVAHRAGVPLAAVQRDVGSRDHLVAAMVQRIVSSRAAPRAVAEHDPVDALSQLAEDEWADYVSHPWLVGVMASTRPPLVPAVLDASRAAVEVFLRSGADSDTAFDRYLAFSGYIQGMGLLLLSEHQESVRAGSSYRAWWREEMRRLARTGETLRHPWLAEAAGSTPEESFDVSVPFRDGLRRILPALVDGPAP